MLDSEIGSAMTINSIAFKPTSGNGVIFDQLTIYMGSAAGDVLGSNFMENYSGDRVTVYDHASASLTPSGGWVTIPLDTPYFFSGSGNLIIELEWPNGDLEIYSGHWATSGARILTSYYGSPTGDPFEFCPNLLLSGTLDLAPMTFGSIKASFL